MSLLDPIKRQLQHLTGEEETPLDGDTPAWLFSLVVHLTLLIVLAGLTLYKPDEEKSLTVTAVEVTEEVPEAFLFSEELPLDVGADSIAGTSMAMASAPTLADISEIPPELMEMEEPEVQFQERMDVSTSPILLQNFATKGEVGVGVTGAAGAIDRITREILLSLEERKTLVVWLFDQSGSLDAQRKSILKRFDRVYEELGVIEKSGHESFAKHDDVPLLTSIVAFGENVSFLTEQPTDDVAEIKAAVESVQNDASGIERVFTAIGESALRYSSFRNRRPRRNVMIVVLTDEAGDDEAEMEKALAICLNQQIPVYVVGVPAPFGRTEAVVKYVDPDPNYDQSVQWIPVRQGPETLAPERLLLSFSDPEAKKLEQIDSGFGPYFLTRFCYETGGIYFSVHPNKETTERVVSAGETPVMAAQLHHFFDDLVMRRYRPDYVSVQQYKKLVASNKARAALVEAARRSRIEPMDGPRLEFPKRNDAELKRSLDLAQREAAKLEPKLEELYGVLRIGEADRQKLPEPRWRAGYDLAVGRVLATKVRTEGYNVMLAQLKQGKEFAEAESDTWQLTPAETIESDSQLAKLAEEAQKYLKRVVDEHADTPWALLAQHELDQPLGWRWTEKHTGVTEPRPGMGNNNNPLPRDDQLRKLEKPKPKRQNIRL